MVIKPKRFVFLDKKCQETRTRNQVVSPSHARTHTQYTDRNKKIVLHYTLSGSGKIRFPLANTHTQIQAPSIAMFRSQLQLTQKLGQVIFFFFKIISISGKCCSSQNNAGSFLLCFFYLLLLFSLNFLRIFLTRSSYSVRSGRISFSEHAGEGEIKAKVSLTLTFSSIQSFKSC